MITAETRHLLESLGGHKITTRHLDDVYYDTVDNALMRKDHWLRKRDGVWELKYRHQHTEKLLSSDQYTEKLPSSDQYTEKTDGNHILEHLENEFQRWSSCNTAKEMLTMTTVTMDTILECGKLLPIVEVKCARESYVIKQECSGSMKVEGCEMGDSCGEVKVDLDECILCDVGEEKRYEVGEVEMMVASPDMVHIASQRCQDLAQKLGGCVSATPGGKVSFSLQITNPPLWQSLIDASLIRKP